MKYKASRSTSSDNDKRNGLIRSNKYHSRDIGIKELKVEHFMTKNPIVARSVVNFPGGVDVMITNNISNLVVVENRKPIGILTEREILRYLTNYKTIPSGRLLKNVVLQPFCKVNLNTMLLEAARKMIVKKCRVLVFSGGSGSGIQGGVTEGSDTNKQGNEELIGIITASDMVRAFAEQKDRNPSLKSVMSKSIAFISSDDSIYDAVKIMHMRNIGSVIVVEDGKNDTLEPVKKRRLCGIFTERDLMTRVLSNDVSIDEPVGDYCSTELLTAQMGTKAIEAAKVMFLRKIKRLPLTTEAAATRDSSSLPEAIRIDDKYNLEGMVTARDLVDVFQHND
jgi:CBS domain-containing protein